jgi:hypothetical protein
MDRPSVVTSPLIEGSVGHKSAETLINDGFNMAGFSISINELTSPLN